MSEMDYEMEERRRWEKTLNLDKKKVPIPKLPGTMEECEQLVEQKFKVIKRSGSIPTIGAGYGTGGESACKIVLECPFCGFQFDAMERYGCFHYYVHPSECPNCNFPLNICNRAMDLAAKKDPTE